MHRRAVLPLVMVLAALLGQRSAAAQTTIPFDGSARALVQMFDSLGYAIDSVETTLTVPRIFLTSLPDDMASMNPVQAKTDLFIRLLLPLALEANELTIARRDSLLALQDKTLWSSADSAWASSLAEDYRGSVDRLDDLLTRVDAIPPSLVLAQGADESAWGTSRFAREGNSLFGQHTHSQSEAGLVAGSGKQNIQVAAFATLLDGVLSYMHNLNSNPAYQQLRDVRAQERARHEVLDGAAVAEGLTSYSARGENYVHTLQSIIRAHQLHALDSAALDRAPDIAIVRE